MHTRKNQVKSTSSLASRAHASCFCMLLLSFSSLHVLSLHHKFVFELMARKSRALTFPTRRPASSITPTPTMSLSTIKLKAVIAVSVAFTLITEQSKCKRQSRTKEHNRVVTLFFLNQRLLSCLFWRVEGNRWEASLWSFQVEARIGTLDRAIVFVSPEDATRKIKDHTSNNAKTDAGMRCRPLFWDGCPDRSQEHDSPATTMRGSKKAEMTMKCEQQAEHEKKGAGNFILHVVLLTSRKPRRESNQPTQDAKDCDASRWQVLRRRRTRTRREMQKECDQDEMFINTASRSKKQ